MKHKFLFAVGILTLGLTSCHDDVEFDQDTYDTLVKASFPIENVDPNHDWATIGTASVEVSVDLDYDRTYFVGVYLDNPIGTKQATLIYETKMKSGETLNANMSYLLARPVLYVGVFDEQGRGMAEAFKVENGIVKAHIGGGTAAARQRASEDGSAYPDYVKTADKYLNPVFTKVNEWDWVPTVKQISVSEMPGYTAFTDADIEANNTLTNGSWKWSEERGSYQEFLGGGDGKHFRVASGTTITKTFHAVGEWGVYNDVVIYVEGTMHVNGNTFSGPTVVVGNGGHMIIDGNTSMSGAGRVVVLAGGRVTGADGVVYNVNNGAPGYNAGTIDFNGELNVNGSDFYNAADGSIKVDVLRNTSGGKFTNFGTIEARTNTIAGDTYNSTVINGCHMKFTADAGIGTLIMLDNSRLDVVGQAEFAGTQTLYKNSVVNAGALYVTNTVFSGPTAAGEFAIVKTGRIYIGQGADIAGENNTYFDWKKSEIYNKSNGQYTDYDTNVYSEGYKATHYQVTKYIDESTVLSNFTIPAGKCTGEGYNDGGNDGGGKPENKPLPFRFCFEDNFPNAGDYDFNDCVFTVTPQIDVNDDKKVTVTVTLDGVGAQKCISGAIRLVGVTDGMLNGKQCTSHFTDAAYPYADNHLIPDGDFTTAKDPYTGDNSSVVMLLFKDAHWAINSVGTSNTAVKRVFYNTMKNPNEKGENVSVKTATYVFNFKNASDAQLMLNQATYDGFIVESQNGVPWEVHTVQNNRKGALVLHADVHSDYQNYLKAYVNPETSASGKYTWAVMVPGTVKYPVEWQVIGERDRTDNSIKGAYCTLGHSFAEWAENMKTATDWYLYPESDVVF